MYLPTMHYNTIMLQTHSDVWSDAHMLVPSCRAQEARDIFCTKIMRGLERGRGGTEKANHGHIRPSWSAFGAFTPHTYVRRKKRNFSACLKLQYLVNQTRPLVFCINHKYRSWLYFPLMWKVKEVTTKFTVMWFQQILWGRLLHFEPIIHKHKLTSFNTLDSLSNFYLGHRAYSIHVYVLHHRLSGLTN